MFNIFFDAITPIANIFWFLILNTAICLISIHWILARKNSDSNPKYHRIIQTFALLISLLVIGILWIKQWNIGDLLAFYSLFSGLILLISLQTDNEVIKKESRGWFLSILLVFVLRGYIYEPWQIPSSSMKPNLEVGDFVLVNRNAYGLEVPFTNRAKIFSKSPDIGDIVVFYPPHKPTTPFVKRVIAKGGDNVVYVNKKFFVNGIQLDSNYFSEDIAGSSLFFEQNNNLKYLIRQIDSRPSNNGNWIVPEGMFFVSGDNRDNSSDSREWGFIKGESVWGRADYIWLSWQSGDRPTFQRVGKIE
ncbi:MAG: signal peptidase I [Gammaproteobacteria bacterium]|uniref:Signal peptidase I n=1 Tax=SAR86 cluster bacterium TaxID=2030880 RepID=A0A520N1B8_9GAMM|nr:signal peptidase I [SAR86 cluster bacterium]RZO27235.1 MAG: signal peptidase I [SAR86 cluster bacterium]|tara:strand:+ start:3820 stop:4731 length:912 start_codon:yes stop_codon:yes gene_type:complete